MICFSHVDLFSFQFSDERASKDFQTYCENIRRTVKIMGVDLKAKEELLEELIHHWKVFLNNYETLEKWLQEGEYVLRRSSDEKMVFN